MGLENAKYISELVVTNPIGATDPVSEGDNHLRLIKDVLQTQFSGFVGSQVSPKAVTLTEDQINDAGQKSATQTITGQWTFSNPASDFGGVTGTNLLDKTAAETVSGAYDFTTDPTISSATVIRHDDIALTSGKVFFSDGVEPTTEGNNGDIYLVY